MADVFLSYAREDLERARSLAQAIESLGWSVWWDRKIPAGQTFAGAIEEAIDKARCVIVLWSKASVRSEWVRDEADEAKGRRKLVPARLDDVTPPLGFRAVHAAELIGWDGSAATPGFQQLIADLVSQLGAPPRVKALAPQPASERKQPVQAASPAPAAAQRQRRRRILAMTLVALVVMAAVGGFAFKIVSDRAAQAEAARLAEEARLQREAVERSAEARAAGERAAQEKQREQERREQEAAEDARRQAELDTAKRAAAQERARADQLKREMDARARDDAARAAEVKKRADEAAATKAAEDAERAKREREAARPEPVRPPVSPAPSPAATRPTPFMGSLSLSLVDFARRNGLRQADLTPDVTRDVCTRWTSASSFGPDDARNFRYACLGLPGYANANRWNLAEQPTPQLWMGYCTARVGGVPNEHRRAFMNVCLKHR